MENIKKLYKTTNLKYQFLRGMINLNCLMDYVPYLIFKIILSKPVRMYVNKIENRITFKIKISVLTWNGKFELLDGLCSVSYQINKIISVDYFE